MFLMIVLVEPVLATAIVAMAILLMSVAVYHNLYLLSLFICGGKITHYFVQPGCKVMCQVAFLTC